MRVLSWVAVLVELAFAGSVAAVDLTKIDRSIRKEPIYQSNSPLYCLLVFGPDARIRVWVVLDGDVLYADRNGNGDLTDAGERIAGEVHRNLEVRPDVEVMRTFELNCLKAGDETVLTSGPEVQRFYVHQLLPREDWHDQTWVKMFQEKPFRLAVTTKTGHSQDAKLSFATSARAAPILHFDGPRRFALSDKFGPQSFRPGEPCDLAVELQSRVLNTTVRTEVFDVPENVHPVAEIEFPPGRPGEDPVRMRVELKERC